MSMWERLGILIMGRELTALFLGGTVDGEYLWVPYDDDSDCFVNSFRVNCPIDEDRFSYQEYYLNRVVIDGIKNDVFVLNGDEEILKNYIAEINRKRVP